MQISSLRVEIKVDEPWLRECKRLPVGGTMRYRCCGRDKAAVLYNNPEAWEMYCNRCKRPAYKRKQFVQAHTVQVERPVQPVPADVIDISQASPYVRQEVYKLLALKGLMPEMAGELQWSQSKGRIVFPLSSGLAIGRAMTTRQQPKWLQFGGRSAFAAIAPKNAPVQGIVLTEDYLSALKVSHVSNHFGSGDVVVAALLGTRLDSKLKLWIAERGYKTLLMLDGDAAGYEGIARIKRGLRPFVQVGEYTHDGYDPKDMQVDEILGALIGCFNSKGHDAPEDVGQAAG